VGDQSDDKTKSLRADCLAGAYSASVVMDDREAGSSNRISPGDLDEAIKALLVVRGPGDTDRQGTGFERVRAYRDGIINSARTCLAER
jgi:predicted metalloprotease